MRQSGRSKHTLSQCSERDSTVQSTETFLLDNGKQGVARVAVLWNVEWVGHRVVLGLQTDLDDLHWCDDGNSFGDTGCETS